MADYAIHTLSGPDIAPHMSDLARLRITVFREFPYLYDGTEEYEEKYLKTYLDSPESVVILAMEGSRVIGASTGLPMTDETESFQRPFLARGLDPARVFYCAESVLLPQYRGRGIYKHFFTGREAHARRLGRFDWCAFCCVQRPADHPRRPADYAPLDSVWSKFGYARHPELSTTYEWKDLDDADETPKPMIFWLKSLQQAT